jgi:hypothetical protein
MLVVVINDGVFLVKRETVSRRQRELSGLARHFIAGVVKLVDICVVFCVAADPDGFKREGWVSFLYGCKEAVP